VAQKLANQEFGPLPSLQPAAKGLVTYPKNQPGYLPYEPGVVLVRFKDDPSAAKADLLAASLGLVRAEPRRSPTLKVDRMRIATKETVEEAVARLNKEPQVIYAEPNYKIRLLNVPNDPRYGECWGLNNTGQTGGTVDADIDAQEAWDISIGSYSVVVAVLDTGVDYTHPDLAANIWTNSDETPGNGIDDDNNGYVDDVRGWDFEHENNNPMDDYGHGTHCSGIIGAVGNNGVGVAGVNWRVTIMPLRIIGNQDLEAYCVDAAEAIHYAVDNGARIMSCSWWTVQHYSQTLENAVVYADQHDVMLVAAAGNDSRDDDDPAYNHWPSEWPYDNIIAVAATNHTDGRAYFSNWGLVSVDVGAPGEDILSTIWPGQGYDVMSGTSMATPHVAGVVALMLSLQPNLTKQQIRQYLFTTVDPIPDLQGRTVTGGRVNAYRVLQALSGVPLPPVALAGGNRVVPAGTTVQLDGSKSFDPNQDPITFDWDFYPPMNSTASLNDETSSTPSFTADVCGEYRAVLTVSDGTFTSDPDRATVNALNYTPQSPVIETPHPYTNNMDQTWTITQPGAVVMSVHFSVFDTESGYDFVRILDGQDREWAVYDGALGEFTSVLVEGNTIKIHFTSDVSVTGQGFVIDQIRWCDAGRCPPGLGDCDDDPSTGPGGCETDTSSSIQNCGWCGHICQLAHALSQCTSGICQIASCENGWTDCDGLAETGCEADLLSDPQNCSACGVVCGPYDHATPACENGTCAIGQCDSGWDDCNGQLSDGCEQDVSSDIANCGACGNVCNLPHTQSHTCLNGQCLPLGNCQEETLSPAIESPHPYPNNYDNSWVINRPGAAQIALHFSLFDLEASSTCAWDWVSIRDKNGQEVAKLCDNQQPFWTASIPGDQVTVVMHTDSSVTRQGFTIDAINTCQEGCESGWSNCDLQPQNGCESDTSSDVNNCGGCGIVCGGAHTQSRCENSTCVVSAECQPGFADCNNNATDGCEVDLNSDPQHCGNCSTACDYDHAFGICESGVCSMGPCQFGYSDCNQDAADGCEIWTYGDPQNCGACGQPCQLPGAGQQACLEGVCYPLSDCAIDVLIPPVESPHPYPNNYDNTWVISRPGATYITLHFSQFDLEANSTCAWDWLSIRNSQGTEVAKLCGNLGEFWSVAVPGDSVTLVMHTDYSVTRQGFIVDRIKLGACTESCASGYANCNSLPGDGCEVSINDDPQNCGACGTVCSFPHANPGCSNGSCAIESCQTGWGNCNNQQADGCERDVTSDPQNCGACGNVCGPYNNATAGCVDSACVIASCTSGYADCNATVADGCEIDTTSDAANCGACGTVCGPYEHAAAVCENSACRMGACESGFADCDSDSSDGCEIDTTSDVSHCGACDNACGPYDHASAGCADSACVIASCSSGYADCNATVADGCEIDTTSDVSHCGACDNACGPYDHASAGCADSACVIASCSSGYADCNATVADGCEIDTTSDVANCGACGTVCGPYENAVAACIESLCAISECASGYADCNATVSDGCEVDLTSSVENCGVCGKACGPYEHASAVCNQSECAVGVCDEGFGNCNGLLDDGCEVDTTGDVENCGSCGNACQLAHAEAACAASACVIESCATGYQDCNGQAADGCEVDTTSDNNNCGGCGSICQLDHANALCKSSVCSIDSCQEGFADCDSQASNGCETDIAGDEANCGTCGKACASGEECSAGKCTCPDRDGDGVGGKPCGADCNDDDASIKPGAQETCDDSIDNNCDGQTDENCGEVGGGGCSCSSNGSFSGGLWLVLGLALLGRRRRPLA